MRRYAARRSSLVRPSSSRPRTRPAAPVSTPLARVDPFMSGKLCHYLPTPESSRNLPQESLPDEGRMPARLHRWDEIALEKITEMVSQKIVCGEREMLAQ